MHNRPMDLQALIAELQADPLIADMQRSGNRPRVGVSACLQGEPVRYDGDHRRVTLLADVLPLFVDCVPLCPEVAIGLGVPRPAIQRVRLANGRELVRGVEDRTREVTAALDDYARQIAATQHLHGYVLKARSPSCAPGNAPVFDEADQIVATGWGRYAEGIRRAFPEVPICDEESLATPGSLVAFIRSACRLLRD